MIEELKPCPFCGMPHTELYWVTITSEKYGYETLGIFCNNCKQVVTLEANDWGGDSAFTRQNATEAWNRRTDEIIRCKDCKHWDTSLESENAPNCYYCPVIDGTHCADFYCADAERRIDEND